MATASRARLTGTKSLDNNEIEYTIDFLDEDGAEISIGNEEEVDGSEVLLTGYEIGTAAALSDEDTVNEAFAKLEARILELETP